MEKLIKGVGVKDSTEFSGKNTYCDFSVFVRKGHEECGDSAFAYCDGKKFIAGVFDGVSGEPGAAQASSSAAEAVMDFLKKEKKASEDCVKEAMKKASLAIERGDTTGTVLFMEKDGSFAIGSVGDSLAYGINKKGEVGSEIPQSRLVGNDHSIFKYLYFRNIVTSVIGPSGSEMDMHILTGKLHKGEIMILATDGVSDNLHFKIKDGYVSDTAGTADLKEIVGDEKEPDKIVKRITSEMIKRVASERSELADKMLVPKKDDLAIVAVRHI
jgi:serine/threonine protein phosphatase PrpC